MNDLIESLICQFKKQRIIRGNIYDNFMFFSYKTLGKLTKMININILERQFLSI